MNDLHYYDQLYDLMKRSGHFVMSHFRRDIVIMNKGFYSIVTNVDLENERFLVEELRKIKPEAGFITEESPVVSQEQTEYTWVIDPLDGTKNFIKGIPHL